MAKNNDKNEFNCIFDFMRILTIEGLSDLLSTPKKIAIIPHQNPDGDALGSCLGLQLLLSNAGHHAQVIAPNPFPHFLAWLPKSEDILIAEDQLESCKSAVNQADLIATLDFNHLSRCGVIEPLISEATQPILMVDHHISPADYATYMYSDTSASSTSEMIYHLANYIGLETHINADIATCLYTGILTDTGSFKYPNAGSETLRIAANLVDSGADKTKINALISEQGSLSRLKLMGRCLDSLEFLEEYHTVYMCITENDKIASNFQKGDSEGFVNFGLSLKGCCFSVIFIENSEDQSIKLSLRSTGDFDVNQFARDHFNGGGHKNAAGGKINTSIEQAVALLTSLLPHYKESLKTNATIYEN